MAGLKRLLPRFSLRTLVVFMLLVTSGMGLWWHWEAWYCAAEIRGEGDRIESVHLSPDGERLLTGEGDGVVRLREMPGLRVLETCEGPVERALSLHFTEHRPPFATMDVKGVRTLRNAESGEPLIVFFWNPTRPDDFPPDAEAGAGGAGETHASGDGRPFVVPYALLDLSADGRLALAEGRDGSARVFEVEGCRTVADIRSVGRIRHGEFSPDGRRIFTICEDDPPLDDEIGSRHRVDIWSSATGERIPHLDMVMGGIVDAAFSSDGRRVLAADYRGTVVVFDAGTGRPLLCFKEPWRGRPSMGVRLQFADFSPDGGLIRTAWNFGPSVIRDAATGALLGELTGDDGCFSPQEDRVFTWGAETSDVCVWDASTGGRLGLLREPGAPVWSVEVSPDAEHMVVRTDDMHAYLYRRRRPEWWWGVFWLWEFWLTAALAAIFVWSVVRDRRRLARTG